MLEALPELGAVPPDHFGVTAVPSTWNALLKYAVVPVVTKNPIVMDCPVLSNESSVVEELPRTLTVQLAEALDV
jgi:hypothetical protein